MPLSMRSATDVSAAAFGTSLGLTAGTQDGANASFSGHYRFTSGKLNEVQGRYLATRHQLEQIRRPPIDNFTKEVESTKVQVSALLAELEVECRTMHEVEESTQALSQEISGLLDNDEQMRSLLQKMSRKLDAFQQILGNA